MHYHVIIIGGGPAGLSCAQYLAEHNIKVLLIEQQSTIGPKVCAGGITWNGLLSKLPAHLIERSFPEQYVETSWQQCTIKEKTPIIATVNRTVLGTYMAEKAREAGVTLITDCRVVSIEKNTIQVINRKTKEQLVFSYNTLVGGDGACSIVRRFLKLPVKQRGLGINCQIPANRSAMEWHLNWPLFKNGYAWIFPHKDTISVGAYAPRDMLSGTTLMRNFRQWTSKHGLVAEKPQAALVCYDYRGWDFGNIFLIGEAAGFASGLTGEGIYPAIVSGEEVARRIVTPSYQPKRLQKLITMQRLHSKMVSLTKSRHAARCISEAMVFLLRTRMLSFRNIEMAE
ncbi:MAG: monooxygenase [Acidobacteria bacterium]|nr:MAG: monooxygenase [Acidobacteriota bacterium]